MFAARLFCKSPAPKNKSRKFTEKKLLYCAVCAGQCVDGTKTLAGDTKMSAPAQRASVRWWPEKALQYSPNALNLGENAFRATSGTFTCQLLLGRWFCRPYQGVRQILGEHVTAQSAKRSELHTFKVKPQRLIVERSFAWLDKNHQLYENCERWANTSL